MMAMAYQSDEQIAEVLTHVRSNFGNNAAPVTAIDVAALRSEVGKPQLTVADLIQPELPPVVEKAADVKVSKYHNMKSSLGLPPWVFTGIGFFTLVCVVGVFRK
jgi:hypothetical protein